MNPMSSLWTQVTETHWLLWNISPFYKSKLTNS